MRLHALPGALLALTVCALALPAAAAGELAPWQIGAARAATAPPAFDAARDLVDFPEAGPPVCPRVVYSGTRKWRFEEPYVDTDASGDFNYPISGGVPAPEPFCDYNANGHWDGIYVSGGIDHPAGAIHDPDDSPLDARAVAISDGTHTVVLASVVAQGIHENYTHEMRARAEQLTGDALDGMVVSANHNESSPDTVGIYGAPEVGGVTGANSGIDEYYMDYLVERVAQAAADAYADLQPASLWEREFPLPPNVEVELSDNFPTTDDAGQPAAIDPKVRVLQARTPSGDPIFTLMNLAAHNQEIGHGDHNAPFDLNADWPGYFHTALEDQLGGMAMFLVGANGSEEDAKTVPAVTGCPSDEPCYAQAQATGQALADTVADEVADASPVAFGAVGARRDEFFAPIENNLFKAAAVAGLFGERSTYTGGVPTGRTGEDVRTEVNVLDVGPDLQFIANPGEAFPALMLGSPWGIEDVGCPNRPNPPVPTWHAGAGSRFQVGLANDMIGYEIPAWAFSAIPGAFTNEPPYDDACVNDMDDKDPAGHQHKLETEGVGPTASNMVAERLTALLDQTPDAGAQIVRGRYVRPDGSLSRRPEGAAGIWFADAGSSTLAPGSGTIVASAGVGFFGSRAVDANGQFIDYDGVRQSGPDITTRGMARSFPLGPRYYLDVYPGLTTTPLGPAQPPLPPDQPGQPEQPPTPCPAFAALPQTSLASDDISVGTGHLHLSGTSAAGDNPCGEPAHVDHVDVAVAKRVGRHRCRFFSAEGELGKRRPCRQRHLILAQGTEQYSLDLDAHLRAGRYSAVALATDSNGTQDLPGQGNRARFRVR